MASSAEIIKEHVGNMRVITEAIKGKLELQRSIMQFIQKHKREEEERRKHHSAGEPLLSRAEELIQKRSEAQKQAKRKKKDGESVCSLDIEGAHVLVRVTTLVG